MLEDRNGPPPSVGITGEVLILEDLPEPRRWLCDLVRLAWPGVGWLDEAADLQTAHQLASARRYQVALVDWELPDGNAAGLIHRLSTETPETLIVVSTIHEDDDRVFAALRAGAQGYILKSQSREQVLAQLKSLANGEPALSPTIAHKVLAHFRALGQPTKASEPPPVGETVEVDLTARERDVLRLLAKGYRNAEASELLGITPNTLGSYIKTVYRKLGISSRAQAAVTALRMGLTD